MFTLKNFSTFGRVEREKKETPTQMSFCGIYEIFKNN